MRKLAKVLALLLGIVLVLVLLGFGWASMRASQVMARSFETHSMPEPAGASMEESIERGRHLLDARYACRDCHGSDLSGGTMVDAFPLGTIMGPNLTSGAGGVVAGYTFSDWDRIVRHGVLSDGRPALMPSVDFTAMSDQELADIIAYIGTLAPVDREVPAPTLGPLGRVLVATGRLPFSADRLASRTDHPAEPPAAEVTTEFGAHLAAVCTGCHGQDLAGGPIPGGDPSWLPAANLTMHQEGLSGWSFDDFARSLRDGVRPDGTPLRDPMTLALPVTGNMTDTELEALWLFLSGVEPRPTGT